MYTKKYIEGYEPEPPTPRPTPVPDYRTQITVSIAPPQITIIPVGGSITLSCSGHLVWNGVSIEFYTKLYLTIPISSKNRIIYEHI